MESKPVLTNNCWVVILDYLDVNSLFYFELVNKSFQTIILYFYHSKEMENKQNTPNNQISSSTIHNKNYKRLFLSKYFNLILQASITNGYCNDENLETNEGKISDKIIYQNIARVVFGKS